MKDDDNLFIFAVILEVITRKRMPSEEEKQRILAALSPQEGRFLVTGLELLSKNAALDPNTIRKLAIDAISLMGSEKEQAQTRRLDVMINNPPASLIPLKLVFENLMNRSSILTYPQQPTFAMKVALDQSMRVLRNRLGIPNRDFEARIAGYRAAGEAYDVAYFNLLEAFEHSISGDLEAALKVLGDMDKKDAFQDSGDRRKSLLMIVTKELTDSASPWIKQARSPVGPDGLVTAPMRESIRKILGRMAVEQRAFDSLDIEIAFQLASLIEDFDTAALIFSNQMRIDPKGMSSVYLRFVKAMNEPMAMIEYLKIPNGGIKGDIWTALRIRIHRDYPELVKSVPELNGMPENPFQPTSVDHPQPFIYNIHTDTVPKLIDLPVRP